MNQFIALALIVWIFAMLLTAYLAYERIKAKHKRERFERSLYRWRING
jgi:hypothetical protein